MTKWDDPDANLHADLQAAGPAVSALQAKLGKITLATHPAVPMNSALFLAAGDDWDPKDHPKDAEGKFVEKHKGTFIFGKAKKAKFVLSTGTVETTLNPGDQVFKIQPPSGTAGDATVIQHADGSMHMLVTHSGGTTPVSSSSTYAKVIDPNKETPEGYFAELIKQAPGTEVVAESIDEAKEKINSIEGKVLYDLPNGEKIILEKNQQVYTVNQPTKSNPDNAYSIVLTDGIVDDVYKPNGEQVPDDSYDEDAWASNVASKGVLAADGAQPPGPISSKKVEQAKSALVQGGTFTHPTSGAKVSGVQELHQHKMSKDSFLVKTATGWHFFDKNGKMKAASETIHLKHLGTNYSQIHAQSSASTISHPASGGQYALKSGEKVYKNSLGQVLVEAADGSIYPLNTDGELSQHPVGPNFAKNVKSLTGAWALIAEAPVGPSGASSSPSSSAPKGKGGTEPAKPSSVKWSPIGGHPEVTLQPGDSVFKYVGGGLAHEVIVHADGSGVKYHDSGAVNAWGIASASHYKKSPVYETLHTIPLPKVQKPTAQSEKDLDSLQDAVTYDTEQKTAIRTALKIKKNLWTKGSWNLLEDSPLKGGDVKQQLAAYASLADVADKAAATLQQVSKKPWDKTEKQVIGKDRSRFEIVGEVARLAQLLQDPDSDEAEIDAKWALVAAKLSKPGVTFGSDFPFPAAMAKAQLEDVVASWKFKKTLTGIDFDPDDAPLEVLAEYAAQHGFPAAGGLDLELAKQWVKYDLGDPSVTKHQNSEEAKKQILAAAYLNVAAAQSKIFLESLAPKTAEPSDAQKKALDAQKKAILQQAKKLATLYEDSSTSLAYDGPDEWVYEHVEDGTIVTDNVTTAVAMEILAKNPDLKPPVGASTVEGQKPFKDSLASFEKTHGSLVTLSPKELNTFIKIAGGSYVGKMSTADKQSWIRYHLAGDEVAKYNLEAASAAKSSIQHKDSSTHPGSPSSPSGKIAHQLTADFLASQEWWQASMSGKSLASLTVEQSEAAYAVIQPQHFLSLGVSVDHPTITQKRGALARWLTARWPLATPSFDPHDLELKPADDTKPDGVDEQAWMLLLAAEKGGPEVTEMIQEFDPALFQPSLLNLSFLDAQFVPDEVKRLALWSKSYSDYGSKAYTTKAQVRYAITHRVQAGTYIPGDVPVWTDPWGKKWPLAPGTSVHTESEVYYLVAPDGNSGTVATSGGASSLSSYMLGTVKEYKKVLTIPNLLTLDQAKADGLSVNSFIWDTVEQYESTPVGEVTLPGTQFDPAVLLYELKHGEFPPTIKANPESLPLSIQKLALWAEAADEHSTLDLIEYKLKNGHYSKLTAKAVLDPSAPFAHQVMKGKTTWQDISGSWTFSEVQALGEVLGVQVLTGDPAEAQALENALKKVWDPQAEDTSLDALAGGLPDDPILTPLKKSLGGMHSKSAWTDQHGNEWMTKSFPSDPNAGARIDAEDVANRIGLLFGFNQPKTLAKQVGGSYSYVQHLKPATGSMSGKSLASLTDEQLAQGMEEHVLDWLISNHDSHPENLLLDPNGKDIIGIDKGQAWRFFGASQYDEKLAVGYKATNPIHVWYDEFYKGVQSGTISKERADKITKRVLTKAYRMQTRYDDEFRALLDHAFSKRKTWPDLYPTKAQFIDAVMARKASLLADFEEFYKEDLYGKSPHSWDIDVEALQKAKLDEHTHVAVSQEFAEDVVRAATHGKALMFATPDLEDSHILVYTEKKAGNTLLKGEARVRKDADLTLTKWLKAQTVQDSTGAPSSLSSLSVPNHENLPNNDDWFSKIKAAAMTVNHHAGDGEYNMTTLGTMADVKSEITQHLSSLMAWEAANPDKPFTVDGSPFVTKEQQNAWKGALEKYLNDIGTIEAAKANATKVVPHVTKADYHASKNLDTKNFVPLAEWEKELLGNTQDKKATAESEPVGNPYWSYTDGDVTTKIEKVGPNKWLVVEGPGSNLDWFTDDEMASEVEVLESDGVSPEFHDPSATEDVSAQGTTSAGQKTLTVKRIKAHGSDGQYDLETGHLTQTSTQQHGFTGYQYNIEYEDVVIEYRPWKEPGVAAAQQGLLKFTVQDWTGDPKQIEDVLDTLRHIGLELTEADEEGLQLLYWRMLYGVLQERSDRTSVKYKPVIDHIQQGFVKAGGNLTPAQELDLLKVAWAKAIGQDKVDNADWRPKFSRFTPFAQQDVPGFTQGHPYWMRPDYSLADYKKFSSGRPPASSIGNPHHTYDIAMSGYLPSEERLRILAEFSGTGGFDSQSQDQANGASGYVYTRQNKGWNFGKIHYHPKVALRTHNYSFSGDNFGKIANRKTGSPFDLKDSASTAHASPSANNELMIKYGLGFDDIAAFQFASVAERDKAVKKFKALGITTLHGLSIEEIFVTSSAQAQKAIDKVWKIALQEEAQK